jgi:hypothetical protein
MPRTTIDIDAPILREVKSVQKKEQRSLGQIVSQLLAEALARRKVSQKPPEFKWVSRSMKAFVDIEDKDALYALMEKEK